jgi:uncharacterized membrane protein
MADERDNTAGALRHDRVAALADGVFAIVLTLLIIEIKAPEVESSHQLGPALLALTPKFFAYVLTFAITGIFWFGHYMEFHYIKRSDRMHLWLNLLFLLPISFLPFSASLLGGNLFNPLAAAFYGVHLSILGFIRYLHWRYATDHHRLVDAEMHQDLIDEVSGTFLWVAAGYLVAAAIAYLTVQASLILFIALASRYVISAKQDKHLTTIVPDKKLFVRVADTQAKQETQGETKAEVGPAADSVKNIE